MNQYRIAVMILTYRQSDVIGKTLDSILCQKEFGLNEIIISDDCSPDNNWEVISEYVNRFPNIIKAYRNEHNMGIYGNANKLASIGCSSDLYMILDGDDQLCDGWFKAIQEFLSENQLNLRCTKSVIYSDFLTRYPDGTEKMRTAKLLEKGLPSLGLKLREILFNRSFLATREVLEQYTPVDLNHGLPLVEEMFDSQVQRYSDKSYYCPFVGSIYNIYSGVTKDLCKAPLYEDRIEKFQTFLEYFEFNEIDKAFLQFRVFQNKFLLSKKLIDYSKALVYYFKGTSIKYGYNFKSFVYTFGPMTKAFFAK